MGYLELLRWRVYTPTLVSGLHESCTFSQESDKQGADMQLEQARLLRNNNRVSVKDFLMTLRLLQGSNVFELLRSLLNGQKFPHVSYGVLMFSTGFRTCLSAEQRLDSYAFPLLKLPLRHQLYIQGLFA